jgi:hypothetical protein
MLNARQALPFVLAAALVAAPLAAQTPAGSRYNLTQQKGSHNSEQRNETLPQALQFDPAKPYQAGCRNLELDLVQDSQYVGTNDTWAFAVDHSSTYNWKIGTLYDDLMILRNWHLANPGHDVVTVAMDLKNAPGDDATFVQKVEGIFTATLGADNLYSPGMLQGSAPNLLAGARANGWPTLGQLTNKFILVFTGADGDQAVARRRTYYSTTNPTQRLAFVDLDARKAGTDPTKPPYTDGYRVFINIQYGSSGWCSLATNAQRVGGFATRAWTENDSSSWNAALAAAVNILATDKVSDYTWAQVGNAPFRNAPVPGTCN